MIGKQNIEWNLFFWNPRHLLTCEGSHSRYSQFLLRVTTFSLLLNSTFFCWKIYFIDIFCQCQESNIRKKRLLSWKCLYYSESVFEILFLKETTPSLFFFSMHDCLPQIGKNVNQFHEIFSIIILGFLS